MFVWLLLMFISFHLNFNYSVLLSLWCLMYFDYPFQALKWLWIFEMEIISIITPTIERMCWVYLCNLSVTWTDKISKAFNGPHCQRMWNRFWVLFINYDLVYSDWKSQNYFICWQPKFYLLFTYWKAVHLIGGSFELCLSEDCPSQNFSIELIWNDLIANIKWKHIYHV